MNIINNQTSDASILMGQFKQIIWVTMLCVGIGAVSTYLLDISITVFYILFCDFFIMCSLFSMIKSNKIELAKQVYIWTNLLVGSYLFWNNTGISSSGFILTFPIYLVVSALIGGKKTFFAILAFSFILILASGLSTMNGWSPRVENSSDIWHLIISLILISASAYTAWRFSHDMKYTLNQLKEEVDNVNQSRNKIERLIHNDALTGLSSRLDCKQKYNLLSKNFHQTNNKITFLFLDIDNFKAINDYYSHSFGDKLLKKIASRLREVISEDDIACRLSGDEFLLIINRPENYKVALLAEIILKHLSQPIEILEYMVEVTISIGATTIEDITDGFETVIKQADMAMHRSKQSGKNQYAFYDNEILNESRRKLEIINGLKAALKNDDLELFLQPKVDISSGKIRSVEALIRWVGNNPKKFSPAEFIPLIESTELICSIGEWVISNACRLGKQLQDNGFDDITISVNISAAQFARGNIEEIIINELQKSQLPPECLELELTEHILFQDDEAVLKELGRIKDLGLLISIDDFGTGYSNLGYLTKLKVDILKIDRSFITNINESPDNFAIVNAIIKMATTLGLKVVAEGVETSREWNVLKKLNCHYGQGYLWSKPVAINDFVKLPMKETNQLKNTELQHSSTRING